LLLGSASLASAATEGTPRTDAEPAIVVAPTDQPQAEPASPPPPPAPAATQGLTTIVTILPPERPARQAPALKLVGSKRPAQPAPPTAAAVDPAQAVVAPPPAPSAVAAPLSGDPGPTADSQPASRSQPAVAARRKAAAPAPKAATIALKAAANNLKASRPASDVRLRAALARRGATAKAPAEPKPAAAADNAPAPPRRLERASPTAVVAAQETIPPALVVALGAGLVLMLVSTLPRVVAGSQAPRWVGQSQVAVGGIGLACALGAFAVMLAAA
ncbi:MAG TPA: hypothetical protein VFR43_07695, partial [Gaiellaceae bacterium]|nr:hypothetical protein [Gaiellaceae bacterium]